MRRTHHRRSRFAASAALATLFAGCGGGAPPGAPPEPTIDAEDIALTAEAATRLAEPVRILFEWNLNERGVRLSGRGVARAEPPYRARLDLFMENGETVARAALVDDDLRIPRGMPEGIIPPAPLLWATLGVFRPGAGSELLGGRELDGDEVELRYETPEGVEVRYRLDGAGIRSVELLRGGRTAQRVEIRFDPATRPWPAEAGYRNIEAFRELTLRRESVERVEPYPPDIWLGGG